mgnify:CR=1 FL=1
MTRFIDTNILLYLLSTDTAKASRAEEVVRSGGMANVMRRKLSMPWCEINEVLTLVRSMCPCEPLTLEIHERGLLMAERYGLSIYDGLIVAVALVSQCETLYSEDMQHGLLIDGQLRIQNPFC